MKTISKIVTLISICLLLACNGSNKKKDPYESKEASKEQTQEQSEDEVNKGIGPFTSVEIASSIDDAKVKQGKKVFNNLCTACHKMEKKWLGRQCPE